jgi:hypothetical protein
VLGAVKAIPPDLQLPHSEIDPMPFKSKANHLKIEISIGT